MFHCTILFALKPGIALDRVRGARHALAALVETMPGVEHFTVTHNVANERGGYTLALFSGFANRKACEICLRHPEFVRVWREQLEPVVERHVMAQGDDHDE
ncbi:MAG: Dabb family protein [Planctomycetes bacterium]|nr:Dabb family protein [Planctomycetota bacterium]